jgi:hypothetical protein
MGSRTISRARDLEIEGIEGEQVSPPRVRREQCCQVAVAVVAAQLYRAISGRLIERR